MDETTLMDIIRSWADAIERCSYDETVEEMLEDGKDHVLYLLAQLDAATERADAERQRAERAERERDNQTVIVLSDAEGEQLRNINAWMNAPTKHLRGDYNQAVRYISFLLNLVNFAYGVIDPASSDGGPDTAAE